MLPAGNIVGALYHELWTQSSAPEDGRKYRPKYIELIEIINKLLLLHLVGCLYYWVSLCLHNSLIFYEICLSSVSTFKIGVFFTKISKVKNQRNILGNFISEIESFVSCKSFTSETNQSLDYWAITSNLLIFKALNSKINYGLDTAGEKEKGTSKKNVDGRRTSSHDNK